MTTSVLRATCPWCLSGQATRVRKTAGYTYRCNLCQAQGPVATTPAQALELWNHGPHQQRMAPLRALYEALSALVRLGACNSPQDCRTPGCTHIAHRIHQFLLYATNQTGTSLAELDRNRIPLMLAELGLPDTDKHRQQATNAEREYAAIARELVPAGITRDDFIRWRLVPDDFRRMVRAPEVNDFVAEVAAHYGCSVEALMRGRTRDSSYHRHICIWLAQKYLPVSLPVLAEFFGYAIPSITYAIDRIERDRQDDAALQSLLTTLGAKACHRAFTPREL